MMKSSLFVLCGTFVLGLAAGCGAVGGDASTLTSVTANELSGGQVAVAEGEARLADDRGPRERPDCGRLAELLGLSDDQVAAVKAIEEETRTALSALRQQVKDGALTKDEARAEAKALREAQKAKVMALLTPEQQAKFAELRGHHGRPFDLDRLAKFLGLSADQVTAIKALMTDTQTKVRDLRSQVEGGSLSADEARGQIQALLDAQKAAIEGTLTAEQLAKLAMGMRGGHEGGGRPGDGPRPPMPGSGGPSPRG